MHPALDAILPHTHRFPISETKHIDRYEIKSRGLIASDLTAGAAGKDLAEAFPGADTADPDADTEPTEQSVADRTEVDPAQTAEEADIVSEDRAVVGSSEELEDDPGPVPTVDAQVADAAAVEGVTDRGQDEGDVVDTEVVDDGHGEEGSSEETAVDTEDADMGALVDPDAEAEPGTGKTEDSVDAGA